MHSNVFLIYAETPQNTSSTILLSSRLSGYAVGAGKTVIPSDVGLNPCKSFESSGGQWKPVTSGILPKTSSAASRSLSQDYPGTVTTIFGRLIPLTMKEGPGR